VRRREFITLLGAAAAAWPLAAGAQQAPMPVIGFLSIGSLESNAASMAGFRRGLNEQGFVEGRNVMIETRFAADARYERLLALASDLVRRPVAVLIATGSASSARAAKAATTTIPIVFANGSDPVSIGLVASMNRPGGNATGVSYFTSTLGPKRLELLRELVPQATTIAFLVKAARSVGQRIIVVSASNEKEIDAAFESVAGERAGALLVNVDAFFLSRRDQLVELAARYRVPASYNNGEYVKVGGLMSYGDNRTDSYRQVGVYAARVLKGEKPADLPVMQPTKFELFINLKTAKALGLEVPPLLLARADEVIE
jgi:putative tryptophan/tyrosine transport system substrate-binding protein